jgi:hypothetical protein
MSCVIPRLAKRAEGPRNCNPCLLSPERDASVIVRFFAPLRMTAAAQVQAKTPPRSVANLKVGAFLFVIPSAVEESLNILSDLLFDHIARPDSAWRRPQTFQ